MMSAKVLRASRTTRPMVRATLDRLAGAQGDERHQEDDQQFKAANAENIHGESFPRQTFPWVAADAWFSGHGKVQPGGTTIAA